MEYESKLSDIIASLPEVSGGFLYSMEKGVYANQTSGFAEDASLQEVGSKLTRIVSMITDHYQDTGGIRVSFKDFILYGTQIAPDHWLFLLHQPSLSSGMIKMTVRMAMNIEEETLPSNTIAAAPIDPPEQAMDVASDEVGESVIDILLADESELKEPLLDIQEQLAHFIGPVAELVFKDSVEAWAQNAIPSIENIPGLLDLLKKEIDDEDDRAEFRNNFS